MTTLTEAFKVVDAATTAHDLFNGDKVKAQKVYRDLAKVLHPDHVPAKKLADANAAFAKLSTLWDAYVNGDADRTYASVTIATRKHTFVVGDLIAPGDITGVYRASFREDDETKSVALKLTRDPRNNDLTQNEARVLAHLADNLDPVGIPYVSQLLESFRFKDSTSNVERHVNVLSLLDGWFTLQQVLEAYPDGLDIRDTLWMWKRLLIGIGHAHRAGVVHTAVLPTHVLVHPEDHGLCIVDWSYARVEPFTALTAIVPSGKSFYPSDVLAKGNVSPKTDVAMASRTIATLFNAATPIRFQRFAKACWTVPEEDAWALMNELTELAADHFPRKFRPFSMPVKA